MQVEKLTSLTGSLYDYLLTTWLKSPQWSVFYIATEVLANNLPSYAEYLKSQSKKMKFHHNADMPIKDNISILLLKKAIPKPSRCLEALDTQILLKNPYDYLYLGDFMPSDRRQRYLYINELKKGLSCPCVLCTYSIGGPIENYLFLWPLPEHVTLEAALNENQRVVTQIKNEVPVYHRQVLRNKLIHCFGSISPKTNLATLCEFHRAATGDQSASLTTNESEIDERLREALEMEDPDIVIDLREVNKGHSSKFSMFWEKMNQYLNEASAVHER